MFDTQDVPAMLAMLSELAQAVVPHAVVRLIILRDDQEQRTIHARVDLDPDETHAALSRGPATVTARCDFHISDDLPPHSEGGQEDGAGTVLRSLLRVPIEQRGELLGCLDFLATERAAYDPADVVVARRIARHAGLALAQQRLAEENRRAANLERIDSLLETLTGVLDIREVFTRVSEIARQVIPHDAIGLPVVTPDREHAIAFAMAGVSLAAHPPVNRISDANRWLLVEPWEYDTCDDLQQHPELDPQSHALGYRSALRVPVRLDGQLAACLVFLSRAPAQYRKPDLLVARRIADHIALALSHQRLADQARQAEELRARTATLELLDDLLAALIDTGDLPDVFDRVSDIARKVLRHDTLLLVVALPDGRRGKIYASSGVGGKPFHSIFDIPDEMLGTPDWDHEIADDLSQHPVWRDQEAAKRGLRSSLNVAIRLEGKLVATLAFLAFEPALYKDADLLVARRIRDRIALCLARGRGAEASKQAEQATARASWRSAATEPPMGPPSPCTRTPTHVLPSSGDGPRLAPPSGHSRV